MPDRTVRAYGISPPLNRRERHEVEQEVSRLRELLADVPGERHVEVKTNPSGLLGIYVTLLLEGVMRGIPDRALVPWTVRLLYGRRPWFKASMEALMALLGQFDMPDPTSL